jgi:hypothetical protein
VDHAAAYVEAAALVPAAVTPPGFKSLTLAAT